MSEVFFLNLPKEHSNAENTLGKFYIAQYKCNFNFSLIDLSTKHHLRVQEQGLINRFERKSNGNYYDIHISHV